MAPAGQSLSAGVNWTKRMQANKFHDPRLLTGHSFFPALRRSRSGPAQWTHRRVPCSPSGAQFTSPVLSPPYSRPLRGPGLVDQRRRSCREVACVCVCMLQQQDSHTCSCVRGSLDLGPWPLACPCVQCKRPTPGRTDRRTPSCRPSLTSSSPGPVVESKGR